MEFELYNWRAFEDHLDNPTNYKEIQDYEARLINKNHDRWICEYFIDAPSPGDVSLDKTTLLYRSLCSKRDTADLSATPLSS